MKRASFVSLLILTLGAVSSARAQQPAAQPPAPTVKENATVRLGDHTYAIPDGSVPLVPNVGIVVGSRGTLVIDPGLGRPNGEAVLREVAKVKRGPDLYIATTHFHAEHTTGAIAFPPSAKYIDSRVQEAEFAEGGMQMVQLFASRSAANADFLKDAAPRKADVLFDRDYTLDLGGVRVRFVVVGPTHTKGDTVFFVEGDNVLFAGDVVMNNSFLAAGAASSMRAWLAAFDTLEAMRPTTVVPSHGPIGDGSLVPACRRVMQAIDTRARALKLQGKSVDDTVTIVQAEMRMQHPEWPRANGIGPAVRAAYNEAP